MSYEKDETPSNSITGGFFDVHLILFVYIIELMVLHSELTWEFFWLMFAPSIIRPLTEFIRGNESSSSNARLAV